jgi:hypothetical protein
MTAATGVDGQAEEDGAVAVPLAGAHVSLTVPRAAVERFGCGAP